MMTGIMSFAADPKAEKADAPDGADILIFNADVRTMAKNLPRATAVAIEGGKIISVGDLGKVQRRAGPKTKRIDAKGKLVLPGFNDSHVHFLDGGFGISNIKLRDAATPEEFARRIGEYAKTLAPGKWITGGEWDHQKWPGTPLPTKQMIDAVTPNNPVFVSRTDGHMGLGNSLALKLAGITKDTTNVHGGFVVRDEKGEPTGILKDASMDPIWKAMPQPDFADRLAAAKAATEYAVKLGVTSVQDMSANDDIGLYQALADRGELKTRIYGMNPIRNWEALAKKNIRANFGTPMVRMGGLKGFADGSLGSSTAYMFEPFSDDPKNTGLLGDQMFPEGIMLQRAIGADSAGLQIMIHAIGDRANCEILDIYKKVVEKNGTHDRRFRIEHAQHLRPSDIKRFGTQHVVASMQPYHAIDDGRWCDGRIGTERSKGTYAFRSLLDSEAILAFGTDWTVAPLDPMLTIYAAVTRRTLDDKHPNGWVPEQKISVEEAVRAYTLGSAFAEFQDTVKGTVSFGKYADLVMLDKNIFEIDPNDIPTAKVVMTILDGKIVYQQ
ncbi:MAG: nfdA 3 [Verrucomicrobiales bacterium]|nr:nfdA 3 [Verrucomicrobiales bacterium]